MKNQFTEVQVNTDRTRAKKSPVVEIYKIPETDLLFVTKWLFYWTHVGLCLCIDS